MGSSGSRSAAGAEKDPLARARALALRLLASRARTSAQIRERLARAGYALLASDVVAWLDSLGYLNDAAYARAHARSLLAVGRAGPRLAEQRLAAAGIPPEDASDTVAAAMRELAADHARQGGRSGAREPPELALCRAAAVRRTRGAAPALLGARGRARLARFLLARGFSSEAVARVVGVDVYVE